MACGATRTGDMLIAMPGHSALAAERRARVIHEAIVDHPWSYTSRDLELTVTLTFDERRDRTVDQLLSDLEGRLDAILLSGRRNGVFAR